MLYAHFTPDVGRHQWLAFAVCMLFFAAHCEAQTAKSLPALNQMRATAVRTTTPPTLDGRLDDPAWQNAPVIADRFTQEEPNPGSPSRFRTEVRIVYDDLALYFGAKMYDVSGDSIMHELYQRDGDGNADWFGLNIDTYHDLQNDFAFWVSPDGVQNDARDYPGGFDVAWNAVWDVRTHIDSDGWTAEIRIPFSALRFPKQDEQLWGLQIGRSVRRVREQSWWSPYDPTKNGFINQAGILEGIRGVQSPLRLALLPYASVAAEHYPYNVAGKSNISTAERAGLDIKYGINDAFTLDMTLVPDFGQTRSDNRVLNLTPYEVKYNEYRPFFTEGTELFNKGDFFYSRRIGRTPHGFYTAADSLRGTETLVANPSETQLINSTKVSGRTASGLGLGILNSITSDVYAVAEDAHGNQRRIATEPLTNYNVAVVEQSLPNNSFVTVINTNVWRASGAPASDVAALLFDYNNKANLYGIGGTLSASEQFAGSSTPVFGHRYVVEGGKRSGNFLWSLRYSELTETYRINDLGYLAANNFREGNLRLNYNRFKRWGIIRKMQNKFVARVTRIYNPDRASNFFFNAESDLDFTNYLTTGIFGTYFPLPTYDYYEPRAAQGRYYTLPTSSQVGMWFSSDYRKPLAVDASVRYRAYNETAFDGGQRNEFVWSVGPRIRFSDHLLVSLGFTRAVAFNEAGFVQSLTADNTQIYFGRRNVETYEGSVSARYIFTPRMFVTLNARHYWSAVRYRSFHFLNPDGSLAPPNDLPEGFTPANYDTNFAIFNADFLYSWEFATGSYFTVSWKSLITPNTPTYDLTYVDNLAETLRSPASNTLSVKLLYYLDVYALKQKLSAKHWGI